jgi:hypothetical protein
MGAIWAVVVPAGTSTSNINNILAIVAPFLSFFSSFYSLFILEEWF